MVAPRIARNCGVLRPTAGDMLAAAVESLPPDLDSGLRALGYDSFRPGQREAVDTLLSAGRLLLVAPTGGGKSLAYQLPATVLGGTTLVVSPLIALMHDQVTALDARGVRSSYLASTLDRDEQRRRLGALARGEYCLVYVAPERLGDPWFCEIAQRLACPLVAVDEAHCISEWGHDFRPEYMQIASLLALLPQARVLACTATATPVVRDEIISRLGLPADTPQIVRGFARPNLALAATDVGGRKQREREVDALLAKALGGPRRGQGTAIVYSPTRKLAEQEAERLGESGWQARCYHAGLPPEQRSEVQGRFIRGELEIVVATTAFGMGIDRADVRAVVHLGPPASIEAYYQEVGRAGRDGAPAFGLMLHSAKDLPLRRRLLEMSNDDRAPDPAVVEHKWSLFLELMRWAEGGSCRHDAILRYFGDDAESLGGCKLCDVCGSLDQGADVGADERALIVRKALSGVARVHDRFGLGMAAKLLHGDEDPRLTRAGLDRVTTFGVLRAHPLEWIGKLIQRCVTAGWVGYSGGDRPVLRLTAQGVRVMKGELAARMLLPRLGAPSERPRRARESRSSELAEAALDAAGVALFERLRAERMRAARAGAVPAYVVATDRSLRDMALLRPTTRDQLLMVHGFGSAKADRYGDGFLAVIRSLR
jgi:ATP-dependent DNA helicase RecQ